MRAVLAAVAVLSVAATSACAQNAERAPTGFRAEFLHQFDNSMARVIALAEAVPAETYARRAVPAVQPLGQIFAHIAHYNYEYPARAMGIAPPAGIDRDTLERVREKAQVVALLRRSADHVRTAVRGMPEEQLARQTTLYGRHVPQWAVLFQLIAHMDDHLGPGHRLRARWWRGAAVVAVIAPLAIGLVTLVVRDYDEAIAYYTARLGFTLLEDRWLSPTKRWVRVAPSAVESTTTGTALLLAQADSPEQRAHVGNQTGGRVAFFLATQDFAADFARLESAGVRFVEAPRHEEYGTVAVFEDLYGNRWDLVQHHTP